MPRRNRHPRRRNNEPAAPLVERTKPSTDPDFLARRLVSAGLAPSTILDATKHPVRTPKEK